jgi:hypothetical protein
MVGVNFITQFWVEQLQIPTKATTDAIPSSEEHLFCSSLSRPTRSSWGETFRCLDDQRSMSSGVRILLQFYVVVEFKRLNHAKGFN